MKKYFKHVFDAIILGIVMMIVYSLGVTKMAFNGLDSVGGSSTYMYTQTSVDTYIPSQYFWSIHIVLLIVLILYIRFKRRNMAIVSAVGLVAALLAMV